MVLLHRTLNANIDVRIVIGQPIYHRPSRTNIVPWRNDSAKDSESLGEGLIPSGTTIYWKIVAFFNVQRHLIYGIIYQENNLDKGLLDLSLPIQSREAA